MVAKIPITTTLSGALLYMICTIMRMII